MKLSSSYVDSVIATSKDIKDRGSELIVLVDVLANMAKMVQYIGNLDAFCEDMQYAQRRYVECLGALPSALEYSQVNMYGSCDSDEEGFESTGGVLLNSNTVRFMADRGSYLTRLASSCSMFLDFGHYAYDSNKLRTDMDAVLNRICYIRCECPEARQVPMSTTERLISIMPTVYEYLGES